MHRLPVWRTACLAVALAIVSSKLAVTAERTESVAVTVPTAEQLVGRLKPQHPRLLLDAAGWEDLRKRIQADPTLQSWDKNLQQEADKLLAAPLPRHVLPDGLRLLSTSRSVLERTYTLGLTFRLHGDRRHADRLWQELQTVAAFPDFNPKHFLDTAEMTHALAIAYDWLYDVWSPSQRSTIRGAIVEMGLKPGLDVYKKKKWWSRSTHNWNQVCNGGMTIGALAVGDEEPKLAGEILQGALVSVPLAMASYAPDGAWGEGPGYWNYATSYNVFMLAALISALGTDFGLSGQEGFHKTGLFPLDMMGPTGRVFNFSDCGERMGRADCLYWLAERFHQPVYAWFAGTLGKPSAPGMIWYRGPGQDPVAAGLPLDRHWRRVEVVTLRSRWNDPQATFVAIQAGSNQVNHNHLDLGGFVLDALGHRWAVDLGGDNYNLPGYFGKNRYKYYRLRAEGHNTLVLNPDRGPDQDPRATATISGYESRPELAFAIADLTPAYTKEASRVQRGIAMLQRRYVLLQDEIVARKADAWWFLHTPAAATLAEDGRTVTLTQSKAKLLARILSPAAARFEVRPAEPLPTSPHPEGQRKNDPVRKLAIHLPEVDELRLTVLFIPLDGQADAAFAPPLKRLAEW